MAWSHAEWEPKMKKFLNKIRKNEAGATAIRMAALKREGKEGKKGIGF